MSGSIKKCLMSYIERLTIQGFEAHGSRRCSRPCPRVRRGILTVHCARFATYYLSKFSVPTDSVTLLHAQPFQQYTSSRALVAGTRLGNRRRIRPICAAVYAFAFGIYAVQNVKMYVLNVGLEIQCIIQVFSRFRARRRNVAVAIGS